MTTAALYARKSNEQERAQGGTTESSERQRELGTDYIAQHGWSLGPVYTDDMVSGLTYAKLDGRKAMIADAEAGKFQVLVVAEQSRLGRDMIEVAYWIKQLTETGVRIYSRAEGEISVDGEQGLLTIMRGYKDQAAPRDAARRVYDAALQRINHGFVAGAKVYGYRNITVASPSGERKKRQPHPEELAVVQRIFQLYAAGIGSSTIADTLNAEHVPAPRPKGWSQAGIRQQLKNPLYKGDVIWGRLKKTIRRGKRRNIPQPEDTWKRSYDESLRIIDDVTWQRCQAQREKRRRAFPRSPSTGKLLGRPSWRDGHSEHLWPGLATCGCCQGSIRITHRKNGKRVGDTREVRRLYTCATHDERGPACPNDVIILREKLDAALVEALTAILDGDLIAEALDLAVTQLQTEHATALDQRAQHQKDLAAIQGKIDRLMEALEDDTLPDDEIRARLKPLRARKATLTHELASLQDADTLANLDVTAIRRDLVAKVKDLKTLFGTETQQSRALLRRLLAQPIQVTPFTEPTRRGWRFTGTLVLTRLMTGDPVTLLGRASGRTAKGTSAAAQARAPRGCGCRGPGAASPR